jgi:hypothetical protein
MFEETCLIETKYRIICSCFSQIVLYIINIQSNVSLASKYLFLILFSRINRKESIFIERFLRNFSHLEKPESSAELSLENTHFNHNTFTLETNSFLFKLTAITLLGLVHSVISSEIESFLFTEVCLFVGKIKINKVQRMSLLV